MNSQSIRKLAPGINVFFSLFLLSLPFGDAALPGGPAIISPTKLAFILFAAVFAGTFRAGLSGILRRPDAWIAVLLFAAAFSLVNSVFPGVSALGCLRLAAMAILFLAGRFCLSSPAGRAAAAVSLVVAGAAMSGLGIYQTLCADTLFGLGTYDPYQSLVPLEAAPDAAKILIYRASGAFSHPNELGFFLLGAFAAGFGLLLHTGRKPLRVALALVGAAETAAMFLTFSRSAWLGLALMSAAFLAAGRGRAWLSSILALGLLASLVILPHEGRQALGFRATAPQGYDRGRIHSWQAALAMVRAHPLAGVGLGTFAERFDEFKPEAAALDYHQRNDAHNTILALSAEAGIFSGLAMAAGIAISLLAGMRRAALRKNSSSGIDAAPFALIGLMPGLLLNSFPYSEMLWLAMAWCQHDDSLQHPGPGAASFSPSFWKRAAGAIAILLAGAVILPKFHALLRPAGAISGRYLNLELSALGRNPLAHPRIYMDAAALAQLRARAVTNAGGAFAPLARYLENEAGRAPPAPGLEDMRQEAGGIPPQALAWALFGRQEHLDKARRLAADLSLRLDVERHEDIEIAETIFALALAYDWLYAELTAHEKTILLNTIGAGAEALSGRAGRFPMLNNHRIVDAACLAVAGLACYGDSRAAAGWIRQGNREIELCARSFSDDGISPEGVAYAGYALEYILKYYAAAVPLIQVSARPESWIRAFPEAFLRHTIARGAWKPGDMILSFGDSPRHSWYGPGYLFARIACLYGDPVAQELAAQFMAGQLDGDSSSPWLYALWFNPENPRQDWSGLPAARTFPNWGIHLARDSWRGDETVLGFKCSPAGGRKLRQGGRPFPGLGHAHPDANSFVLFAAGEHLITHPGPSRLKRTANHNTVLVNGRGQTGEGSEWFKGRAAFARRRAADLLLAEHTDYYDYIIGDAAPAYDPDLLRDFTRQLFWLRPGLLFVFDHLGTATPSRFQWLLHTTAGVSRVDERTLRLARGRAVLTIRMLLPETGRWSWETRENADADPEWGVSPWTTIELTAPDATTDARFLVVMQIGVTNEPAVFPDAVARENGFDLGVGFPDKRVSIDLTRYRGTNRVFSLK